MSAMLRAFCTGPFFGSSISIRHAQTAMYFAVSCASWTPDLTTRRAMCRRSQQQLLQRGLRHRGRQAGGLCTWGGEGLRVRAGPHGRAFSWLCSPWCSAPPPPLSRTLPALTPLTPSRNYYSVGCKIDLVTTLYRVGSGQQFPVNYTVKIRST